MIDTESIVRAAKKISPVIIGIINWGTLVCTVTAVEILVNDPGIKNVVRGIVYGSLFGAAVVGWLGRRKRAKAKIYNDGVCIHDPDSGRDIHYEWIARFHVPNLAINPWAVFAPIMADVVRLSKTTGTISCTPKTTVFMKIADNVRWNLGNTSCNEVITGDAAKHLIEVQKNLEGADDLTQQQLDIREGLKRMLANGLKIKPPQEACPTASERAGVAPVNDSSAVLAEVKAIAEIMANGVATKDELEGVSGAIDELEAEFNNRKSAVTKAAKKSILMDDELHNQLVKVMILKMKRAKLPSDAHRGDQ